MLALYTYDGRVKEVVRALAKSSEFMSKYVTNRSTSLIVDFMYDRLLARIPDSGGKAEWVQQMSKPGYDYRVMVDQFLATSEYMTKFTDMNVPGNGRRGCSCCGVPTQSTCNYAYISLVRN